MSKSVLLTILFAMNVGYASAGERDTTGPRMIPIEKDNSSIARIGASNVTESGNGLLLRSHVVRRYNLGGPIPGHARIVLLDNEGQTLAETVTSYRKPHRKSQRAPLLARFEVNAADVAAIRITHQLKTRPN